MGRTEPSIGQPPAAFRKDARAKKAKATLNKVIPALLSAHPRAKRGIDASELVVDPPAQEPPPPSSSSSSRADGPEAAAAPPRRPRLVLRVTDTLTAARALLVDAATGAVDRGNRGARVGVLNMASALRPGGGFLNGAAAGGQEEALCLRTTLLPALRDAFYRLPETGAVYTPDVLVFREGGPAARDLAKSDRWFVDCLTAAALRFPDVVDVDDVDGNDDPDDDDDDDDDDAATGPRRPRPRRRAYADPADRGRVRRQMRAVLRLAQARRRRRLVLGAWGCAAPHNHPVAEVAAAWRAVLLPGETAARASGKRGGGGRGRRGGGPVESWAEIETVVFAIPDPGLADAFAAAFGEGLVREEEEGDEEGRGRRDGDDDDDGADGAGDDDDVEAGRMRELLDKIGEMRIRVQQAKSPHLQAGLRSVLQTLEAQLPPGHGAARRGSAGRHPGSDDEDEEEDDDAKNE